MPKRKNTHYSCTACGAEALRWEGRCPRCEAWDSLVEIDAQDAPERFPVILGQRSSTLVTVDAVSNLESSRRITFGLPETMRVLGGGLVPGSAVLLAGEPGIGKSTLLLQMAAAIAATGASVLYVAGEESPGQIGARAQRLGLGAVSGLSLLAETNVASLLAQAEAFRPHVVLVDSVQSLTLDALGSAPGSLAQVRECASRLVDWAKRSHIPVIMTGHVTKDGAIAGPKVLEHTVDAVLSLEGDSLGPFRVLRATKNRFGSTNEVAVFEMAETGLTEVNDPSSVLLAERPKDASGTAVVPIIEGSRPLLVEVQALVSPAAGPEPRRAANGG
ncbi:MAG: AAA family ATPase, partial [Chloroflexi bacterium]|nr:AAA family ATPase [Chloroflexota bacterium]